MTKTAGKKKRQKSLLKQIGWVDFNYVEISLAMEAPSVFWIKVIKTSPKVIDKKRYYKIFYEEI